MSESERASVELLTLRLATVAVGIIAVAATSGTVILFIESREAPPAWAFTTYLVVAIGPPMVAGALAPWVSRVWLRRMAGIVLAEYAVLLALMLTAAMLGMLPAGEVPWYFTSPAIAAAAAVIAGSRRLAWWVIGVSVAAVQVVRSLTEPDFARLLSSDLLAAFASATVVLLLALLLRTAGQYDREADRALAAAAARSARSARGRAADRFAALIHDELLATLLAATEDRPDLRAAVAQKADRARRLLRELRTDSTSTPMSGPQLLAALRIEADAASARFHVDASAEAVATMPEIPASAAAAILGASAQALANAVQHAAADRIELVVTPRPDGVRVVVQDDGRGFEPTAVHGARMGVVSSILGRVQAVPGGEAELVSAPGAGTRVTVGWSRPEEDAPSGPATRPPPAGRQVPAVGLLDPQGRAARRALLLAIGAYLLGTGALAVLAAQRTDGPWIHASAWAGIVFAFAAMGWSTLARPGTLRCALVVAATAAVAALTWLPISRDTTTFGDIWYIPALALMLVVLAVRGRSGVAALGGGLAAAITITGAIVDGDDPLDLVAGAVRLVAFLLIGLILVLGTAWIQRRTAAVQAQQLAHAAAGAAREAGRRELRERSGEVEALIGRTLDLLAGEDPLTPVDRAECAALEGRLRDQYRAGRLAREPLTSAAMRARRRGVDVVLLDDPDRVLAEPELAAAAHWVAERLDVVVEGVFTGRILPENHTALASAVTEYEAAQFAPATPVD